MRLCLIRKNFGLSTWLLPATQFPNNLGSAWLVYRDTFLTFAFFFEQDKICAIDLDSSCFPVLERFWSKIARLVRQSFAQVGDAVSSFCLTRSLRRYKYEAAMIPAFGFEAWIFQQLRLEVSSLKQVLSPVTILSYQLDLFPLPSFWTILVQPG